MIDMSITVVPKSDQLNADDLIAGTQTLEITGVKIVDGEQRVVIDYKGGEGRPYKPCITMRRLMIHAWGKDGSKYVGKQMTVFADPKVKWGGAEVGGIRISHMSHIESTIRVMLTVTRGKKVMYVVEPIVTAKLNKLSDEAFNALKAELESCKTMAELQVVVDKIKAGKYDAAGMAKLRDVKTKASEAIRTALPDETK